MEKHTLALALLVLCCFLICPGNFSPVKSSLSDYDLSHYFGRSKPTKYEIVDVDKQDGDGSKQFNLKAFGRDLSMILNPVDGLFRGQTDQCHYEGKMVDGSEASIAISVCNGLSGYISIDGESYFITKLSNEHSTKVIGIEDPHIVYKSNHYVKSATDKMKSSRRRRAIDDSDNENPIPPMKYVEVNVYVDNENHNSEDIVNDVISRFNMVKQFYKKKSLGCDLQIELRSITNFTEHDLTPSYDSDVYLANFCQWQQRIGDTADISILITGLDLQSLGDNGITGQASSIGGACDPENRCAIVEDDLDPRKPAPIFTIAHEMAHLFGIFHDESSICRNEGDFMTSSSPRGPNAFTWSSCSKQDIYDFLNNDISSCMNNKPTSKPDLNPGAVILEGSQIDATEQCKAVFPNKNAFATSTVKDPKETCGDLRCDTVDGLDISANSPPLSGTMCGRHGFCFIGNCFVQHNTRQCTGDCNPTWATGTYGACISCQQTRTVICTDQQSDGTIVVLADSFCSDIARPATTQDCNCNLAECDCGTTETYQYVTGQFTPCNTACGASSRTRSVVCTDSAQNTVPNSNCEAAGLSTPPSSESCTNYAGCQYQYSPFGACSVTCGIGSQTRTVSCVNLITSEVVNSANCVTAGLSQETTIQTCNLGACTTVTYIFVTGSYGSCSVSCGTGIATRAVACSIQESGTVVDTLMCINAGLTEPETTTTCNEGACPTSTPPQYMYVTGNYGECSASCGGGTQTRTVVCTVIATNAVVSNDVCTAAGIAMPASTTVCNTDECVRYLTTDYSDCSVTCGVGIETRQVICITVDTNTIVDSTLCENLGLAVPELQRACDTSITCPMRFVYDVGSYSACSVTCGAGIQTRSVVCIDTENSDAIVDNSNCGGNPPASVTDCNLGTCVGMYQFLTGAFTDCNCEGTQTREVFCVLITDSTIVTVSDSECLSRGMTQPPTTQVCTPPSECMAPVWFQGPWSECSVTCGVGTETRLVYCLEFPGSTNVVDDSNCDSAARPEAERPCDTFTMCPDMYAYFSTSWSQCSVTCGEGVETRTTACYRLGSNFSPVDDAFCAGLERPATTRPCSLDPCAGVWVATDWSQCSASCDSGSQDRTVNCYRTKSANELLNEAECSDSRPPTIRGCYLQACPMLPGCGVEIDAVVGETYVISSPLYPLDYPHDYECPVTISATGGRIQVTFTEFNVESCTDCECDSLTIIDPNNFEDMYCGRPEVPFTVTSTSEVLNLNFISDESVSRRGYTANVVVIPSDGIQYVTGQYGECSVTCGEGIESRTVTCYFNGVEVDETICSGLERPPSTRPCTRDDCPPSDFCGNDTVRTVSGEQIQSPGFPDPYTTDLYCVNAIIAPVNHIIEFTAILFSIDDDASCSTDSLTFSENGSEDYVICGTATNIIYTSTTNEVNVTFRSDSVDGGNVGYIIRYDFVRLDVRQCNLLREPGPVFSPNYPSDYDNDDSCITTVFAPDQCIRIVFENIDIEESMDCTRDYLEIQDLLYQFLEKRICGNPSEDIIFESFSSTISLQFQTDSEITDIGYYGNMEFVDCPSFLFVVGDFSECSAPCGGGVRTRTVECVDSANRALTDAFCSGDPPARTEECNTEECPSCDIVVTDTASGDIEIQSPNYPENYNNNENCTYTIVSPLGNCIALFDRDFDLEAPDENGRCINDYVEVVDLVYPTVRQVDCGNSRDAIIFLSLSSQVQQRFVTNDNVTDTGFLSQISFIACPEYGWLPGEWSDCSETCGEGERTRTVDCWFIEGSFTVDDSLCAGEKPPELEVCIIEDCPDCDEEITAASIFENKVGDTYLPNQDCVYTVTAPEDMCVQLFVILYELEEPTDGVCADDYFTLTDNSGLDLDQTYCGTGSSFTYNTAKNIARIIFHSDDENEFSGISVLPNFVECPTYIYRTTEFTDCDRTCGSGMQTRTAYCYEIASGNAVDEALCSGIEEPPLSQACNDGPCPECDMMLEDSGLIAMDNYEPELSCLAELTVEEDACISITSLVFDLPDREDGECSDYIQVSDIGNDAPPIIYCGSDFENFVSRSNQVEVRFVSNNDTDSGSYTLVFVALECPTYGFVSGPYDDCTRTCGTGTQTRMVECQELATDTVVVDSLCTDARPSDERECNTQDCPPCGEDITTTDRFSDPAGENEDYNNLQDCTYEISVGDGLCPTVYFSSFKIQEPDSDGNCLDYVEFNQPGYDGTYYRFCGNEFALIYVAGSQEISMNFFTDDEIVDEGFTAFSIGAPCATYANVLGEYSECSTTCGEGYRSREIICVNLDDGSEADDPSECDGLPLPHRVNETCNLEECPGCNIMQVISTTERYTADFQANTECELNITTADDSQCLTLFFTSVDIAGSDCEEYYIKYYDANAPWLSGTLCDNSNNQPFNSQSNNVVVEGEVEGSIEYYATSVTCPDYGFVATQESCSVTCGEGVLTRNYECQRLETGEVVDDDLCGEVPSSVSVCELDECPSCNMNITMETTISVTGGYANNEECTYSIYLDSCFTVVFANVNLEPVNEYGDCVDYFEVTDYNEPALEREICTTISWTSASNRGSVEFNSNGNITGDGYIFIVIEVEDCAEYGYDIGDYTPCPCGSGEAEQTREVNCIQLSDDSVVDDSMCPGERPTDTRTCQAEPCDDCYQALTVGDQITYTEDTYVNDINCTFNITSDPDTCFAIIFISFNLEESENCENDFVQVLSEGIDDTRLCGRDGQNLQIYTRTNEAQVIFQTNDNITENGFSIFTADYECPEYGYVTGDFSECSRTCGGGTQTRTVECQKLVEPNAGQVQSDESLCTDNRPDETRSCENYNCPVCLMEYQPSPTAINTDPFDNNTECFYRSSVAEGCLLIILAELALDEPDENGNCSTDFLKIRDLNNPEFLFTFCGDVSSIQLTTSSSNEVEVEIHVEDGTDKSSRFFFSETDCGTYRQEVGSFGECSATCGGGVLTREVDCFNEADDIVEDFYCYALNQLNNTAPCGEGDCPECGGDLIELQSGEIESAGEDEYPANENCQYSFYGGGSECLLITIDEFDVPDRPAEVCEDYLRLVSGSASYDLCDRNLTGVQFAAAQTFTSVTFVSDSDDVVGEGFSFRFEYQDCPTFQFTVGDFGNCSLECEGGIRTRIVECRDGDGDIVDYNRCIGIKPHTSEECNTDACPQGFYEYVAGSYGSCEPDVSALCFQVREVTCQNNETGAIVDESLCSGQTRPVENNVCTCPVMTTMGPTPATMGPTQAEMTTATTAGVTDCGGSFGETPTSGQFTSPNYPNDYPPNILCIWNFTVPSGQQVTFTISEIDVENPGAGDCTAANSDFLSIDDDQDVPTDICISRTGGLTISKAFDNSDFAQVTFRSNSAIEGGGFVVMYAYSPES